MNITFDTDNPQDVAYVRQLLTTLSTPKLAFKTSSLGETKENATALAGSLYDWYLCSGLTTAHTVQQIYALREGKSKAWSQLPATLRKHLGRAFASVVVGRLENTQRPARCVIYNTRTAQNVALYIVSELV